MTGRELTAHMSMLSDSTLFILVDANALVAATVSDQLCLILVVHNVHRRCVHFQCNETLTVYIFGCVY